MAEKKGCERLPRCSGGLGRKRYAPENIGRRKRIICPRVPEERMSGLTTSFIFVV
jgi:hypothetical protein